MSLLSDLTRARTEEDVKDAYIKALGLKGYHKGLVDIQTEEVWFEAKDAPTPPIVMIAQLLFYVRAGKKTRRADPRLPRRYRSREGRADANRARAAAAR